MRKIDSSIIIRKFEFQTSYLEQLEVYENISLDDFLADDLIQRAIERLLQLTIEVALDVNRYLFKSLLIKQPEENAETFIKLAQLKILDDDLALKLKKSGKMRNLLVHLYEIIEPTFVHSAIKETLRDYPLYQRQILNYLDTLENNV
ncbi:type VII toxin-antitoxin system HepT family RNase toxin [Geminocystis sp. CENA526]|uniref:type VII toxin-antitoxin system HepT family RNase toxin n=1 Tax=Geminocystis sp. CENA526 TaxID=1355871 RepID=UPI003D6ECEEB